MNTIQKLITPELALSYLSTMVINRSLSEVTIDDYASQMAKGQ